MIQKGEGFKTSFKRIKETGRLSKLGRRLQLKAVGITIQLGDHNGSVRPSQQEVRAIAFTTIGEIIRCKSSKVVEGETRSGTN